VLSRAIQQLHAIFIYGYDEFLHEVPHDRPIANDDHRVRDILNVVPVTRAESTSDQLTQSLPQVLVESIVPGSLTSRMAIGRSVPARVPRPTDHEVAPHHLMRVAHPSIHLDAIRSLPRGLLAGLPRVEPQRCCQ